jgi:hypothetical protein
VIHMEIPDFTAPAFDDPWDAYRWLRDNDPVLCQNSADRLSALRS